MGITRPGQLDDPAKTNKLRWWATHTISGRPSEAICEQISYG